MNSADRCGVCPAQALTLWWQDEHDLERNLCGHHSDNRAEAMVSAGWMLVHDDRVEEIRPRLPALTSDPMTH